MIVKEKIYKKVFTNTPENYLLNPRIQNQKKGKKTPENLIMYKKFAKIQPKNPHF